MLNWLEAEPPLGVRGFGLAPYIRIEDFVEDGIYVLRAEMPGIDPDKDVEIHVSDHTLRLRAERRQETTVDKKGHYRSEFRYGSFTRSVPLPPT